MNWPRSPFVGLAAFTPRMADYFTSRERFALTLAGALLRSRITVLYGQSGSGKSSVLGAALPQALQAILRRAEAEASSSEPFRLLNYRRWHPGFEGRLVRSAAAKLGAPTGSSLLDSVTIWHKTKESPVILVLDQFEEFLLYNPAPTATEFIGQLASIVAHPDVDAHILLSLREDSIASLDALRAVVPGILSSPVQLRPLDRAAAEQAIRQPVRLWSQARFGDPEAVVIDDALVATLLDQVRQTGRSNLIGADTHDPATESVELPLLQLSLDRLWQQEVQAEKPALHLQTLETLGGAAGIAKQHLQKTMDSLSVQQRALAIRLFRRLVTPTGGKHAWRADDLAKELDAEGWVTREATRRTILGRVAGGANALAGSPVAPAGIEEIKTAVAETLSQLAEGRARILRTQPDPRGQGPLFELYHDALAAPVLGWVQEARIKEAERRQWRRVLVATGVAALMAVIGAIGYIQYFQAKELREQAQMQEARAVSALAREQTARGDATTGMLASLSMMPGPTGEDARPRSAPAVMALLDAWLSHRELRALIGHTGEIMGASFSLDGTRAVTASLDNTARVWNLTDPAVAPIVLAGHTGGVRSASFSPDGKWVVTASLDNTARAWDLTGPDPLSTVLPGHASGVMSASFSSNGKRVVTASLDNTARVWDLTGPVPVSTVLAGHTGEVMSASFSSDGRRVVTASFDKTAMVWDLTGPVPVPTLLAGHKDGIWRAAFSLDGKRVVTASLDNTARVWDLTGPVPVSTVLTGHTGEVMSASFSPDGSQVVTASLDGTGRVWDLTGPVPVSTMLAGHTDRVLSASFSSDGKRVVTASRDNTARVWDLTGLAPGSAPGFSPVSTVLAGHTGGVMGASFAWDGKRLITASLDSTARIWDVSNAAPVTTVLAGHTGGVMGASFNLDGTRVVTASLDHMARVWDLTGPAPVSTVLPGHQDEVMSASFSTDGKHVVTASLDNTARVWDLTGPAPAFTALEGHTAGVLAASFNSDGTRVVTASLDNTARVWDLAAPASASILLEGHKGKVLSASFSPDGKRVVTASLDNTARVWDLTASGPVSTELAGHTGALRSAVFSSDGKRVVTASVDNTARIWDVIGPAPVSVVLAGHTDKVLGASFSSDGKRVITASVDSTARVWDLTGPVPVATVLTGHMGELTNASFSLNGTRAVTASLDNTARLWDLTGLTPVSTVLAGHTAEVLTASFSTDGTRVVTAALDNTALVHPTPTDSDLILFARRALTRCLTTSQRDAFGLAVEAAFTTNRNVIHGPPC